MNKETILDYATKTPENTNRNVLSGMLDSFLSSNSGGGDGGCVIYGLSQDPETGETHIVDVNGDYVSFNHVINDIQQGKLPVLEREEYCFCAFASTFVELPLETEDTFYGVMFDNIDPFTGGLDDPLTLQKF